MKMKLNMILSKKHIILAALVVALCVAVYLNWEYVKVNNKDFVNTDGLAASTSAGDDATAAYGEAYFAEAKLSRSKSRDEAIEAMKYMLQDAKLSSAQVKELTVQATKLASSIEAEGKIENLIKAKGFMDCMVYYDTERVDVVVKTEGLESEEVTRMKD
ncbi:MAG: SpoIIIAH-like family protein, partial [Angelakisella sp.]